MSRSTVSVYGHWICPFYTRVSFALAQRGISHEVIDLPPSAVRGPDFKLPAEFVEHSPRLEIPLVRIGTDYLADSIPILEWLEQRFSDAPLLPADEEARTIVRSRMAWIDQHAFRPMVGVYYGTDPHRIQQAAAALHDALENMGRWTKESGWLVGAEPTLAEAVAMPIYVRLEGLRGLGFTQELPASIEAHRQRCQTLEGWPTVTWGREQTDELLGRFNAYRRKKQGR